MSGLSSENQQKQSPFKSYDEWTEINAQILLSLIKKTDRSRKAVEDIRSIRFNHLFCKSTKRTCSESASLVERGRVSKRAMRFVQERSKENDSSLRVPSRARDVPEPFPLICSTSNPPIDDSHLCEEGEEIESFLMELEPIDITFDTDLPVPKIIQWHHIEEEQANKTNDEETCIIVTTKNKEATFSGPSSGSCS